MVCDARGLKAGSMLRIVNKGIIIALKKAIDTTLNKNGERRKFFFISIKITIKELNFKSS